MAISTAIAAVANIIGNAIFIPMYGYKAAAYTTLGAYILLTVLHYLFLTYLFKLNFYRMGMFFKPVAITCAAGILSNTFLNVFLVRYLFVLVIVLGGCFVLKKNNCLLENAKEIFKR